MDGTLVVAFWAVAIAFVVTPGADWAYMVTAGIAGRVAPAEIGLMCGHVAYVTAVAAGVGALVARYPVSLTAITLTGAAYLVWLGAGVIRHPSRVDAGANDDSAPTRIWLARGIGVSGLNPKVPILLLALLPQFTDPNAGWPVSAQIGALGALHVMTCAVVYAAVGLGAHRILGARPGMAVVVSRASGALMIVLGAVLLVEQVRHISP